MVQRTRKRPHAIRTFRGRASRDGVGIAQHASCRMAYRAPALVQAGDAHHQRPGDAEHCALVRLFLALEPALCARHHRHVAAHGGGPPYRHRHLPDARAVQAGHPFHRPGGHHPHLYRGDHRRAHLDAGRADVRHPHPSPLGDRDLWPDRRWPYPPEPSMGWLSVAEGRTPAQGGELRSAQARHHLWRGLARHPALTRAK